MPDTTTLHAILNEIKYYQMPEFQRRFVWKQDEVRDLIDTITRGYSAGLLLAWKGSSDALKICPNDWLSPPSEPADESLVLKFVLDGQQRLRTLARTFGIDSMISKGFTNDIDPTNLTQAIRNYPFFIFPSRRNFLNLTKNKRNRWICFDIFLDLTKIDLSKDEWYERISPDAWVSLLEIMKNDWNKETVTEFSILTELFGSKQDRKFYVVECNRGVIENTPIADNWYELSKKKELKDLNAKFNISPIRYIYLNSLHEIENIIDLFEICELKSRIPSDEDKTDFLQEELRKESISLLTLDSSKIEILLEIASALGLGQLTHYFSRINRAGVSLDVVDLLVASIYGDSSTTIFQLRTMLENIFRNNDLRDFFNLKQEDDADVKFKILLQIASLYFYENLSDISILELTRENLSTLEFHEFSIIPADNKHIIIREAWKTALEFLDKKCVITNISKLRSERTFVILVALFCYIIKKKDEGSLSDEALFDTTIEVFLQKWVLRESLHHDLGSASSKPPDRYVKLKQKVDEIVVKINNEDSITVKEMLDSIFMPPVNYVDLHDKACGKGLASVLMAFDGIYDFYDYRINTRIEESSQIISNKIELHHIIPKGVTTKNHLKEMLDCGLNLAPIKRSTNSDIKNKHPFDYLEEILQNSNQDNLNAILKTHCIPDITWWNEKRTSRSNAKDQNHDHFKEFAEEFLNKRFELICTKIKDVLEIG